MSKKRNRTVPRKIYRSALSNRFLEDREYTNDEFYRCALKIQHQDWFSAILHVRRLQLDAPLANIRIYECEFCDGLHITSGKSHKDYFKLKNSLEHLTKFTADPGYIARAPREIQNKHAQIVVDLKARITELEIAYNNRKAKRV